MTKTLAEMRAMGEMPELLFWVGCAGSFDERAQRITQSLARILDHVGIRWAVLGTEENCTGDPAKRDGNEFLFQMMAMSRSEEHTSELQSLMRISYAVLCLK